METQTAPTEELISAKEVASILGLSERTVNRYTAKGIIPHKLRLLAGNRAYRYSRPEVEAIRTNLMDTKEPASD